jgi:hypothetical protein
LKILVDVDTGWENKLVVAVGFVATGFGSIGLEKMLFLVVTF